VKINLPTIF